MPTKRRNAPAKALILAGNQHIMQRIGSSGTITEGPPALPLLEGLCRLPRVADSIIEDAFSRWSAARLIVRNVELIWKERKLRLQQICNNVKRGPDSRTGPPASKRRRRDNSKKHTKQQEFEELQQKQLRKREKKQNILQQHQQLPGSSRLKYHQRDRKGVHWLIRSLSSPSVRERHVALKILVMGCPMDDTSIRKLIELLVFLIKEGNAFRDDDATCMVGWIALLKFILVRVLSGPERLAYCVCPDIGLSWLCQSLWGISSLLQQQEHSRTGTKRVCLSFVDIIHSLVLSEIDDTTCQIHKFLWSKKINTRSGINGNDQIKLSPLACLVGTCHILTEFHQNSKADEKRYITIMKQLINPSLIPEMISRPSTSKCKYGDRKKSEQRLASFLRKPNGQTNSVIDEKEKPPSTATKAPKYRSAMATSTDSHSGNDIIVSTTAKTRNNERVGNTNTAIATSPGGDSIASLSIESSPVAADVSMVASVARLFSTLYSSNNDTNGEGDGAAVDHVQSNDDQVVDDAYHDDNNIEEDGDHLLEPLTDEEEQELANDDIENDELVESAVTEVDEHNKEISTSNEEKDDNDDTSNKNEINSIEEENCINSENDEEIDSEEGEDCQECNSMIDMEDDEEHDHDDDDEILIHEDELPHIEQGLLELQRDLNNRSAQPSSSTENSATSDKYTKVSDGQGAKKRSQQYIYAAMEVLAIQHPPISKLKTPQQQNEQLVPLTKEGEKALMDSVMSIVKPEKKPIDGKIILRRSPTQEEYLRNHSKDIISFSTLMSHFAGNNNEEPTVRDLRQYIADDLQMGDSAEMLEVLVANKILDVDLKLRVILQTVWREHLMQHTDGSSSSSSISSLLLGGSRGGTRSFLSSSSGLSLMLYSSLERSMGSARNGSLSITADTPTERLPPMVMTYRLTGVDGEATEDTVSNLNDPEAPSESEEAMELLVEKQFGITRTVMVGRGVFCLLRSVQSNILHVLKKIRRDSVGGSVNHARKVFKQSFYPGLSLLLCCAKLPSNRKLLLQAQAPTTLLQLLLDVLDALEEDVNAESSGSNSTAAALQELIEILASDILLSDGGTSSDVVEQKESEEDESTLRLLIQAIETSSLSRTLRNVIAKLVPYLTYGKLKLTKELASMFMAHVDSDKIGEYEEGGERNNSETQSVLMDTFIHASISLPANAVCNSLRMELLRCGFIERIGRHILRDCPKEPPSWSPSLWSRDEEMSKQRQLLLEKKWKEHSSRPGLKTSFEILIGLSKEHQATQAFLGELEERQEGQVTFLQFCHWLEATSDNISASITIKTFGLLAETLLDDITEFGQSSSDEVNTIKMLRKQTRNRKKEIAMDRRKKSLMSMNKFGALAGSLSAGVFAGSNPSNRSDETGATQFRGPVLDVVCNSSSTQNGNESMLSSKKQKKSSAGESGKPSPTITIAKPEWMNELEKMEDETGLTCAVCQEGRKYKGSEMMGLYAYMKKVSIPNGECSSLDGSNLLTNLPQRLPVSLQDSLTSTEWYQSGMATGDELKESAISLGSSGSSSKRNLSNDYITTVTAGNAIHISCHAKARLADRNHPKAPKSEWEGAALRNSRVNCNVIFPLVSARSSSVSLFSVEQALTEHQTAVANMIGVRPKSKLWTVLHDVRLMLLRVAYGEALNADCGGGSLGSNSQLIFHQLSMAKMFENEAQVDSPDTARHAVNLSAGFLSACEIVAAEDYDSLAKSPLIRDIADSSLLAALTCILFHNTKEDSGSCSGTTENCPHPKRRWIIGRELFLRGMLNYAGRRHALAIHSSGCISKRNIGKKRSRSRSFAEWDMVNEHTCDTQDSPSFTPRTPMVPKGRKSTSPRINSSQSTIDDFGSALRPMIVYFAILDQLSSDFAPNYDDEKIEESADHMVEVIEACHKSKNIHELLQKAKINLPQDQIINELQRGMMAA